MSTLHRNETLMTDAHLYLSIVWVIHGDMQSPIFIEIMIGVHSDHPKTFSLHTAYICVLMVQYNMSKEKQIVDAVLQGIFLSV